MVKPGAGSLAYAFINCTIASALVANRLYVRYTQRGCTWSDYLILLAMCAIWAQAPLSVIIYVNGGLSDSPDTGLPVEEFAKIGYFENLIYYIPLYCVKASILSFYLDLLRGVEGQLEGVKWATYLGLFFVAFGILFTECTYLFTCWPVSKNWTNDGWNSTCYETGYAKFSFSMAWHMFADLYVYTIPFFLIKQLNLASPSKRTSTIVMMCSGFVLILCAVPNFVSTFSTALQSSGVMWTYWMGNTELCLSILVACLPALRRTLARARHVSPSRNVSAVEPVPWLASMFSKRGKRRQQQRDLSIEIAIGTGSESKSVSQVEKEEIKLVDSKSESGTDVEGRSGLK